MAASSIGTRARYHVYGWNRQHNAAARLLMRSDCLLEATARYLEATEEFPNASIIDCQDYTFVKCQGWYAARTSEEDA